MLNNKRTYLLLIKREGNSIRVTSLPSNRGREAHPFFKTIEHLQHDGEILWKVLNLTRFDFLAILDRNAFPNLQEIEKSIEENPDFGMLYGDHLRGRKRISSFEDPGDITGRFPFGPVRIYPRETINKFIGELKKIKFLPEYHLWLRMEESQEKKVYSGRVLGSLKETTIDKRKESFSYLLESPEIFREREKIFKDMLKRRGAFLKGPFLPKRFTGKNKTPFVSILIPVRNRKDTIEEAIQSALDQTYRNFEILVVDTGSKDGTVEKVKRIESKTKRVRLIQKEGGEISHALNEGIRRARGEFIAQLDSDDFYRRETLEYTIEELIKNPLAALCVSYYEVVDESGKRIEEIPTVKHFEYDRNNLLLSDGIGAVRVWRKDALTMLGGFNEGILSTFGEDYDMALRVSERWEVVKVHRILYSYRRHHGSTDIKTEEKRKILLKTIARKWAISRRKLFNSINALAKGLPSQE